jgi:hypothetical protein
MPSPEEQTYRASVQRQLNDLQGTTEAILAQVKFTNGKVRKLIIALVLIAGIVIGQAFSNTHDIIALLANMI